MIHRRRLAVLALAIGTVAAAQATTEPAGNLTADHPIQGTTVQEFVGAFGNHSSGMNMLRLLPTPLFLFEFLLNPILKVRD